MSLLRFFIYSVLRKEKEPRWYAIVTATHHVTCARGTGEVT